MRETDESLVYTVVGGLRAMILGFALIPLRTVTAASNLAFVFLALTIVVAEFGGRTAALVTAVVSAMSLNFFLTEPYLTLTITKPDDVVAFFALAACGLIAAAFGKRRERWSEVADRAGTSMVVLKTLVDQLRSGAPLDDVLGALKRGFGLGAIVLRDAHERVMASAPIGAMKAAIPETRLNPETLLDPEEARLQFGVKGLRLPGGGGRLRLPSDHGFIFLDLWEGDAQGLDLSEVRTLGIAASIPGLWLSRPRSG
jgi:hypothetical protein